MYLRNIKHVLKHVHDSIMYFCINPIVKKKVFCPFLFRPIIFLGPEDVAAQYKYDGVKPNNKTI